MNALQMRGAAQKTDVRSGGASTDTSGAAESLNATLGTMVALAMTSDEGGCHASEGLLRNCGAKCIGKPHGRDRITCMAECVYPTIKSWGCAKCYGKRADCTMSNCLNPCAASSTGHP